MERLRHDERLNDIPRINEKLVRKRRRRILKEKTSPVEGDRPRGRTRYFPRTERGKSIDVFARRPYVSLLPRRCQPWRATRERRTFWNVLRRFLVAAVVVLALGSSLSAVLPAAAKANEAVAAHKLIAVVKKNLAPAVEKKVAVLVLIRQNGGPPAGAVATPSKPLTVLLDNGGLYRVKAEIDSSCTGSCAASYRISGSANHKLEIVPSCQPKGSGFVCSKVKIVKVY